MTDRGYILLQHGSTGPEALAEQAAVLGMLRDRMQDAVIEPAYLHTTGPGLGEAVDKLAALGMKGIVVMPLFLFSGMHVLKGLPGEIRVIRESHPSIDIVVSGHLGSDPRLVDIIEDRFRNPGGMIQDIRNG